MISFPASQAKTQFEEMMAKALFEPLYITQNGKPSVVIMPVEDYHLFEELKLQSLRTKLERSIALAEADQLHDGVQVFDELMKDL